MCLPQRKWPSSAESLKSAGILDEAIMKNEPQKQTLWLLGCGPGIGMSVASRFVDEGFSLGLITLDVTPIESRVQELRASGASVELLEGDIRDSVCLINNMKTFEQSIGMPAVLVFNASAGVRGSASALNADDLAADLDTNLMAPLKAVQFVLPDMRRVNRGTLLFTGGGIATKPQTDMASGSIGKCVLRQLALLLHSELMPENIHVAIITVSGFVQRGGKLDPDHIAEHYWKLHTQTSPLWDAELEL
jgi:NADP-dependent 3-hydroxy acid dehydrogenase YdfG